MGGDGDCGSRGFFGGSGMEVAVVSVVSVLFVCSSDAVSHILILLTPVYAIMHFHAIRREGYERLALVYGE